nr:reverse transcriptase domain-containing protein [Tanacetum cinerariifolium]
MPLKKTTTLMTDATIKALISQGVATGLAEYEANRGSGNGDDSQDSRSGRRTERAARECTYNDLLKCQPLNFKEDPYQCLETGQKKRKLDNNPSDNNIQQPPFKWKNVAKAYIVGSSEKKEYARTLPFCNKCKSHHTGPCTIKCANCNRVGHLTQDCRSPAATNNQRTLTCYECENQGNYMSDYPKLKNRNHGNQAGSTKAHGMVYVLRGGETDQDLDNIEDDINA